MVRGVVNDFSWFRPLYFEPPVRNRSFQGGAGRFSSDSMHNPRTSMEATYPIMFLGDVVGKPGRTAVREGLPRLIEANRPLFTIINGENSAGGVGITSDIAEEFFKW